MKNIAKDNSVCIVIISTIGRHVPEMPYYSNESLSFYTGSQIYDLADKVIILHREHYYTRQHPNEADLIVVHNKTDNKGTAILKYDSRGFYDDIDANKWVVHTGIYQDFSFINAFVEKPDKGDVDAAVGFLRHHCPMYGCIDAYDICYVVEKSTNCVVLNGKGLNDMSAINDALSHMDSIARGYDISSSQKILLFFTVPESKRLDFIEE